jgi:predicted RND superfamily exporter protein
MLPRHDRAREIYDDARERFGTDESILVAVTTDDVFTPEVLARVEALTRRFEELDEVRQVTSLANSMNIRSVDGALEIDPFIDGAPRTREELAQIRQEALANPVYAGNLVTRDGRTTSLLVYLFDPGAADLVRVDGEIRQIVAEERGDLAVAISGGTHIKAEMQVLMLEDLTYAIPVAALALVAAAFLSFWSVRGIVLPLTTVGVALVWTLAAIAEFLGSINSVTIAAPPIILVVGFAYTVHVVSAYNDALRGQLPNHDDGGDPVFAAVQNVALPVLLTGLTTCAGFLSLAISPLAAIQEFGLFSTFGVVASTVLSLSLAPAVLSLLPQRRPGADGAAKLLNAAFERLAHFDLRHRKPILVSGAVLGVAAAIGVTQIRVSTDFVENLPDGNRTRLDFEAINAVLEGGNGFSIVVSSEPETFLEPSALERLVEIQDWLEGQPEIGGTTSFADYLAVLNRAFHGDDPSQLRVPASRGLVSQLLLIADDPELESFVDFGYANASIVVRANIVDSSEVAALADRIDAFLAELPADLTYHVTGNAVLMSRTIDDIALGQSLSLVAAMGFIYLILAALFASLRIGFIALIPNALPVLAYFGMLGVSGVTLNTTTGLVACIVLGIAVDDTIHFLAHFNSASKRLASERLGTVEALGSVGKPVTYTTAGLCAGFLALMASQLQNQVDFGLMAALTLAVAWLIDVVFTPALCARLRIVTVWDLLSLDLGDDPRRSIPLFAGLRLTQARIVALLGSLHAFPKGHVLTRVGEFADEMWIIIDGELRASLPTEGREVEFGICRRGDTVGEVALFHGQRTAEVVAMTDVRLLRFTHASLDRIRRRYPRIGARLYANLSRILAKRVAVTTDLVGSAKREPARGSNVPSLVE